MDYIDVEVSLRNLCVSGYISIALFTLKPALAILRAMQERTSKNSLVNGLETLQMHKSCTINNKPYFRWKNTQILGVKLIK